MPASLLGAGFEAAAEPAGLVAHVDHLEHRQGALEVDSSTTQAGELAEAQPGAGQYEHVIPPEQRAGGEQSAGFLGGVCAALGLPQDLLGVGPSLGRWHPA
jgi:hypothetical protein